MVPSHPPTFPSDAPPGRPRVVVECADPAYADLLAATIRELGIGVVVCPGPEGLGGAGGCPLVRSGTCEAVEAADLVVSSLRVDHPEEAAVLGALASRGTTIKVLIERPTDATRRLADRVGWPTVLPLSREELRAAVLEALRRGPEVA